jgi:hypothetical protein
MSDWTVISIKFDGTHDVIPNGNVDHLRIEPENWNGGTPGFIKLVDTPDLVVTEWRQQDVAPSFFNRFFIAYRGGA